MGRYYVFSVGYEEFKLLGDTPVEADSRAAAIRKAIDRTYSRHPAPTVERTDAMGEYVAAEAENVQHFVEVWDDG